MNAATMRNMLFTRGAQPDQICLIVDPLMVSSSPLNSPSLQLVDEGFLLK
jgi:hypothetical protein